MRSLRVVADDLTGACDVGGELLARGLPVLVRVDTVDERAPAHDEVQWVDNTQSRMLDARQAARRVATAFGGGPLADGDVAFKKIDTALRGHVAAEMEAAVEALRVGIVLVAAAIPEVGRTTEGGRQLVGGIPADQTAFARDPVNPVRESSLLALLQVLSGVALVHAPLAVVRDPRRFGTLFEGGRGRPAVRVVVADATTDEDLAAAIAAVRLHGRAALVVGSIGAARALVASLDRVVPPFGDEAGSEGLPGDSVLVVAGSAHPATRAQIAAVADRWGILPCEIGDRAATSGTMAGDVLAASGLAVLTVGPGVQGPQRTIAALGAATRAAVARHRPAALVLVGGETAHGCLSALEAPGLRLVDRPRPLVVRSRVVGGPHDGMGVVCKGGSAGEEGALNDMIELARVRRGAA